MNEQIRTALDNLHSGDKELQNKALFTFFRSLPSRWIGLTMCGTRR
jgi:hypothetical protein